MPITMSKVKMRGGRPSLICEKLKDIAINAALLGHTDRDISMLIDINESTLNRWKIFNVKFSKSLKEAKIKSDTEVEKALRKRALGYTYTEVTSENGKVVKEVTKEIPPDTTACNSWLNNRNPERWRDRREHQVIASHTIKFDKMSDEDLINKARTRGLRIPDRIARGITEAN